jgi:membrane-associated phospholipid phosphatase
VATRIKGPLFACLSCVGALILLMLVAYKLGFVERLDASLLVRVSSSPRTEANTLAFGLAHLGDPLPMAVMLLAISGLAYRVGRRHEALAAVAVVAGANVTTQVLKVVLAHPRYQAYLGSPQPTSTAFPSGHATAAASIAVALLIVAPGRLRLLAGAVGAVLLAVVGTSVVVIEWHYPSDVLGGMFVAAGWGFAALAALRLAAPRDPSPELQPSSRFAISVK